MEIAHAVLEDIRRRLVAAYPEEGCGLLVGRRTDRGHVVVRGHLPALNGRRADGGARDRYVIAPEDVLAAERRAASQGLLVVGAYHSHPDGLARPSAYDAAHAWPWYRYLIVSVVPGAAREERVYELRDDRSSFVEHELTVKES